MQQYEAMLAESRHEFGTVKVRGYEADSPQAAYDAAAKDGFVMEVTDATGQSVVDEINMWQ
jgi:hypothetical protein